MEVVNILSHQTCENFLSCSIKLFFCVEVLLTQLILKISTNFGTIKPGVPHVVHLFHNIL